MIQQYEICIIIKLVYRNSNDNDRTRKKRETRKQLESGRNKKEGRKGNAIKILLSKGRIET